MECRNTLSTPTPAAPTVPLSPDVRTAYEDLYVKNKAAIEGTMDFELLTALNASQSDIGGLLSADDQYRLNADSAKQWCEPGEPGFIRFASANPITRYLKGLVS